MSDGIRLSHTGPTTPLNIPPGDIYVQVDTTELEKRFAILPQTMVVAATRAARRTRDFLMTQLTRELAARAALPVGGIRGRFRRGKHGPDSQSYSNEGYAILWIGLNPVGAERAGKLKHIKRVRKGKYHRGPKPVPGSGVRVGKHFFDRAFVANVYGPKDKAWRRKSPGPGSQPPPVVKMTIPINDTVEEILPRYQAAAVRMFSQRLEHEVNFLLENAS